MQTRVNEHQVPAIATQSWDILLAGGLSILFLVPLSAVSTPFTEGILTKDFLLLSIFINYPHFLLSYRLLYKGPESVVKHPWATVHIPVILMAMVIFATAISPWNSVPVLALAFIGQFYLAWHYTGQAFGVISTFAILDGHRISPFERKLLLYNFRILLIWHVAWLLEMEGDLPVWLIDAFAFFYQAASIGAALGCFLGLGAFYSLYKRTGKRPSLRMVVPWIAIYLWYSTLAKYNGAIFWIQIFHALQYMSFPMRVEANRMLKDTDENTADTRSIQRRLFFYFCSLIILTVLIFSLGLLFVSDTLNAVTTPMLADTPMAHVVVGSIFVKGFLAAFNIHHYVIDGVAWKLRDASVRQELMAHVRH